jgi:hypothetical protein
MTAAGMFNTGTNFFIELLERNCWIPQKEEDDKNTWPRKSGVFWQVRTKFRLSKLAIVRKKNMLMLIFYLFVFDRFHGVSTILHGGVVST